MNEEVTVKGVISVTPDSSKLNSATRRNLASKANTSAPPSLSNSEEVPNYLRASSGSCHDFCKYGRKHDSEPKKRRPIFPSFLGINQTTNEEYKARVPVLRGRKKLEVKLKQLKNEVASGSKTIKQKDLSPATVIIPFARADESSEDMLSISSVEHTPASLAEGSSLEVPVSIKVMVPSPSMEPVEYGPAYQAGLLEEHVEYGPAYQAGLLEEHVEYGPAYQAGLFEEAMTLNNSTSSPTIKNIVAAEHFPFAYGSSEYAFVSTIERSTEEPHKIVLMPSSPFEGSADPPRNEVERSSKNSISRKAETSTIEESRLTDVATRANEGSISMKPRNKLTVQKISVPAKHVPYSRASEKSVTSKLRSRSPIKNTDLTAKHVPGSRARKSSEEQQRVTLSGSSDREKRLTELKGARQSQKVVSVRDKVLKQRNIDASGQPNIVRRKTLSPVKKAVSVEPKQTKLKSQTSFKRTIVSGSPKIIKQKAASPPKGVYVKPKTTLSKSTSSVVSSTGLTNQKIQEKRINRSSLTQLGDKKLLRTSRSSVTPNPVNRVVSMKQDRAKVTKREPGTENVKEKTLYMVEPKQVSIDLKHISQKPRKHKSSLSPRSLSSSTSSKDVHSDCDSVFSEACDLISVTKQRSKRPATVPKVENMEKLRRSSTVSSVDKKPTTPYKLKRNVTVGVVDNKPPSPHKMKFRRGKIINLQPESSGPRRLRFRTVRAVSENQSEVMRRSFRKRRESSSAVMDPPAPEAPPLVVRKRRESGGAAIVPPVSEATPTVVLRHQGVQDKKDTQGLFNNVIEETAKQLVEARKSKVKALVGAFETVISLQEK